MVSEEYREAVEAACKELVQEGNNPVRAGKIAERAGLDDASHLGSLLSFRVLDFDEIGVEVIKYEDEKVSNEYRIQR